MNCLNNKAFFNNNVCQIIFYLEFNLLVNKYSYNINRFKNIEYLLDLFMIA